MFQVHTAREVTCNALKIPIERRTVAACVNSRTVKSGSNRSILPQHHSLVGDLYTSMKSTASYTNSSSTFAGTGGTEFHFILLG